MTQLLPMEDAPKKVAQDGFPVLIVLYFANSCPLIAWWNDMAGPWGRRGNWAINHPDGETSYVVKTEPIGWAHLPIKWDYYTRLENPVGSPEPTPTELP